MKTNPAAAEMIQNVTNILARASGEQMDVGRVWICDIVDAIVAVSVASTEERVRELMIENRDVLAFGTTDLVGAYDTKKVDRSRLAVPGYREEVVFIYAR